MGPLLRGTPLLGFADAFDGAYGDPNTPKPYPRVVPSCVGTALLPFACPHCGEVRRELVDPTRRRAYRGPRGWLWCPACQKRFHLEREGTPLVGALPSNAEAAPSKVTRGGCVTCVPLACLVDRHDPLLLLGLEDDR